MSKEERKEQKALLASWTAQLANYLVEDCCMPRSEAFRTAHLTCDLLDKLGRGVVTFRYWKEVGEMRTARGTLCHGISEAFDSYEYKTAPDDNKLLHYGVFTYWDLDKEAFRSFSALRLIEVVEVREVKDK